MSRRGARLTVAVLFALACGAAAWQYWRVERAVGTVTAAAISFDRDAQSVIISIVELRAAQQAYVATGQGADYWTARAARLTGSLRSRIGSLRQQASSIEAAARCDAALAAIEDFARMDGRAREYASSDQRLLASDIIFADGFEMTRAIASEVERARDAERSSRDQQAANLRREEQILAAGTSGLAFLFLLILAFASAPPSGAPEQPVVVATENVEKSPETDRRIAPVPHIQQPRIDLTSAARLCVDLARVNDSGEIAGLLERAATLLDASGIVLWMADPDGRELIPTAAHGYAPSALARVGSIRRDADNATAAAFRESQPHTVKGDLTSSGAIVAPLVTPDGCMGVMAVELRHEPEQLNDLRALASMVAAQLATVIGAAPAAQPHAQAQ